MSLLPDRLGRVSGSDSTELSPRQTQAAGRAQQRTELELFRHGLRARLKSECDQLDSMAVADAMRTALDEELTLLDYGLSRCNGSAAKAELVARKVEMLSASNNSRIHRRFGG